MFKNRKEDSHILKINAITAMAKYNKALLNGMATGMGKLCQKAALPPAKKTKIATSTGGEGDTEVIK